MQYEWWSHEDYGANDYTLLTSKEVSQHFDDAICAYNDLEETDPHYTEPTILEDCKGITDDSFTSENINKVFDSWNNRFFTDLGFRITSNDITPLIDNLSFKERRHLIVEKPQGFVQFQTAPFESKKHRIVQDFWFQYLPRLMENDYVFKMVTLRRKDTWLPVNICLADNAWVKEKHSPRIKFQGNRNPSSDTYYMISMSISDEPEIHIRERYMWNELWRNLTLDDIQKIKQFVKLNKNYLLRLGDRNDDYSIKDFLQDMVLEFPKITAKSEHYLLIIQQNEDVTKNVTYDMNSAIKSNAFLAPLKDKELFSQAKLQGKIVVWDENIQIPLAALLRDKSNIIAEDIFSLQSLTDSK